MKDHLNENKFIKKIKVDKKLNDKEFKWKPKKNIVWYNHNGENINPDHVLEVGKVVH